MEAGRWRALTRWAGSYLVVAARGGTTVVIGDLAGQYPVYWRPFGGGAWWSTAAGPLARLDGSGVDRVLLAARLALGVHGILPERSLYAQVRRVPPGFLLCLTADRVSVTRFEPDVDAVSMAEGARGVAAALEDAVAVRLDGRPVAADLAGPGLHGPGLSCRRTWGGGGRRHPCRSADA
ncbi:hypothetical protein [Streptomyces yaizuensis]|uniref:Uncharacterized protein n=1 Tax=Streptomyces yaizuensis TaxID=2989713 RepID=A0ABQ5NXY1_9ACTN|nr:hypothetical protein [Streptomyces sp. YSPA8]GLF95224.1 hypothetical protein SYYSPA8_13025 [Streptomyces sp. YSPA8]